MYAQYKFTQLCDKDKGTDIPVPLEYYDQVPASLCVFRYKSLTLMERVGWYDLHPGHNDYDLLHQSIIIILFLALAQY